MGIQLLHRCAFTRLLPILACLVLFCPSVVFAQNFLYLEMPPLFDDPPTIVTIDDASGARWSTSRSANSVSIGVSGPNSSFSWGFHFKAPQGQPLVIGDYLDAYSAPSPPQPELDMSRNSTVCSATTGRFRILEIEIDGVGTLTRFAADFEHRCESVFGPDVTFGAIRFNSTVTNRTPFGGAYPDYRLTIVPAGGGFVVGEGILCGNGNWACTRSWGNPANVTLFAVPDPGFVVAGWTGSCFGAMAVDLRMDSVKVCSPIFEPAVGRPSRTLLAFDSDTGDSLAHGREGLYQGTAAVRAWTSSSSVEVLADTHGFYVNVRFFPPTGQSLAPGMYRVVGGSATPTNAGMTIGVEHVGCTPYARFLIREIALHPDGSLDRFSADWEVHCNEDADGFYGAIRYNSAEGGVTPFDGAYPDYRLTIDPTPGGTVQGEGLDCRVGGGICEVAFPTAKSMILSAVPDTGYFVVGWTGTCTGSSTATIFVSHQERCGAVFDRIDSRSIRTRATMHRQADGTTPELQVGFLSPAMTVNAQSGSISVQAGAAGFSLSLRFMPPTGTSLMAGMYSDVTDSPSRTYGALSLSATDLSCFDLTGRFRIREIIVNGSSVQRFAADYEAHCQNRAPGIAGVVWFDSVAGSILPFDGTFPSYGLTINQSPNGTIAGPAINCAPEAADCSVALSSPETLSLTAMPEPGFLFGGWTGSCRGHGTTRGAVFVNSERRCGAVFLPFVPGQEQTVFQLTGAPAIFAGGATTLTHAAPDLNWTVSRSSSGVEARFEDPSADNLEWSVSFSSTTGVALAPGVYSVGSGTGRSLFISGQSESLPGRSYFCFAQRGDVTIAEIEPATTGTITRFSMGFDVQCGTGSAARQVRGVVLYNSARPISEFIGLTAPGGVRIIR